MAAVLASSNFSGTATSFVSSPATVVIEVTGIVADEVSSADTVAIPAAAITVATATEPKATEFFLKAYLIVLLFFNDDMTNSFLNVFLFMLLKQKEFLFFEVREIVSKIILKVKYFYLFFSNFFSLYFQEFFILFSKSLRFC